MSAMILLGAGFSHNWGGWLAQEVFNHLIGVREIRQHERLTQLLWQHQSGGGFEDAIAEVQRDYRLDPARHGAELKTFQDAVEQMFADMNEGYAANPGWEFQQQQAFMVRTFLVQFEAIFSLNQDLLLEQKYLNDNVMLGSGAKWGGWQIPGMSVKMGSVEPLQERATGVWTPSASMATDPRFQPLYKLHGSVNWRDADDHALMIIGGDKAQQIQTHPILSSYAQAFEARLTRPELRLMIIGYGFRDHHINRVIARGVYEHGLQFFVICPEGAKVAETFRSDVHPGAALTAFGYDLKDVFARGCVGISTRKLSDIFGADRGEHTRVMRFVNPAHMRNRRW
jgi:SIR2-like domain